MLFNKYDLVVTQNYDAEILPSKNLPSSWRKTLTTPEEGVVEDRCYWTGSVFRVCLKSDPFLLSLPHYDGPATQDFFPGLFHSFPDWPPCWYFCFTLANSYGQNLPFKIYHDLFLATNCPPRWQSLLEFKSNPHHNLHPPPALTSSSRGP